MEEDKTRGIFLKVSEDDYKLIKIAQIRDGKTFKRFILDAIVYYLAYRDKYNGIESVKAEVIKEEKKKDINNETITTG